ncbi:Os02g0716500 [Oryza sativa Japonica Group]|uniref:Os02g0716500 protein n=1 Tax=Oryza sativa subsp. japonica TaxID=39947 RepID=A0A0P0VNV3_ORYSJ|nr:Os02g0716500 [Oryza sativa Japonica Group]
MYVSAAELRCRSLGPCRVISIVFFPPPLFGLGVVMVGVRVDDVSCAVCLSLSWLRPLLAVVKRLWCSWRNN